MCRDADELVDHLRVMILHLLFSLFLGISWVFFFPVKDVLTDWMVVLWVKKEREVWKITPFCL